MAKVIINETGWLMPDLFNVTVSEIQSAGAKSISLVMSNEQLWVFEGSGFVYDDSTAGGLFNAGTINDIFIYGNLADKSAAIEINSLSIKVPDYLDSLAGDNGLLPPYESLFKNSDSLSGYTADDWLIGFGGTDTISGSYGNDTLDGREGNDILRGADGDDTIIGGEGADSASGGTGADAIYGNRGNDTLYGGNDNDTLYGGQDNDKLFGEGSDDVIYGNFGNDTVDGSIGNDSLFGGLGNDVLYGKDGDDTLIGGRDSDTFYGGVANDWFMVGQGAGIDVIRDFKSGADKVSLMGSTMIGITLVGKDTNIELLSGAHVIVQNATVEEVLTDFYINSSVLQRFETGSESADSIDGGDGSQVINAVGGDDTVNGGNDDDHLAGRDGNDSLSGDAGNDLLYGNAGADDLFGGTGNDQLFGGGGNDHEDGGDGNDRLDGDGGDDLLLGGEGNDDLTGGNGSDTLTGGNGNDVFRFTINSGHDFVTDFVVNQDRIALFGHTVTTAENIGGNAVLTLSDGDIITVIGVTADAAQTGLLLLPI